MQTPIKWDFSCNTKLSFMCKKNVFSCTTKLSFMCKKKKALLTLQNCRSCASKNVSSRTTKLSFLHLNLREAMLLVIACAMRTSLWVSVTPWFLNNHIYKIAHTHTSRFSMCVYLRFTWGHLLAGSPHIHPSTVHIQTLFIHTFCREHTRIIKTCTCSYVYIYIYIYILRTWAVQ